PAVVAACPDAPTPPGAIAEPRLEARRPREVLSLAERSTPFRRTASALRRAASSWPRPGCGGATPRRRFISVDIARRPVGSRRRRARIDARARALPFVVVGILPKGREVLGVRVVLPACGFERATVPAEKPRARRLRRGPDAPFEGEDGRAGVESRQLRDPVAV